MHTLYFIYTIYKDALPSKRYSLILYTLPNPLYLSDKSREREKD